MSNFYRDMLSSGAVGCEDSNEECYAQAIKEDLMNEGNPSYYEVYKNFDFDVKYKCVIQDAFAIKKNLSEKNIIMYPYKDIFKGDLVHWKSTEDYWLCLKSDRQFEYEQKGLIKKCNDFLRFFDEYGVFHNIPCLVTGTFELGEHVAQSQNIKIANNQVGIWVQYNEESKLVGQDTRFIFGSRVFSTSVRDDYSNANEKGLLFLVLAQTERDISRDNFESKVAWNNWNNDTHQISILNGDSLSLSVGDTVQINTSILRSGSLIECEVLYSATDTNVATINESGLVTAISDGATTVTASLKENEAIKDTISINVEPVISDNYNIFLRGDGVIEDLEKVTLYKGSNEIYTIKLFNNGIEVADVFSIFIEDLDIVSFDSNNLENSNVLLKPNSFGETKIHITDSSFRLKKYTIEVKSIFG